MPPRKAAAAVVEKAEKKEDEEPQQEQEEEVKEEVKAGPEPKRRKLTKSDQDEPSGLGESSFVLPPSPPSPLPCPPASQEE